MNSTREIHGENPVAKSRARLGWTSAELAKLRKFAPMGATWIAELLGRSIHSVRQQARRQGISLRRTGERRGRWMGHVEHLGTVRPELVAQIRTSIAAGLYDPERGARLIRLAASGAPLCPACAARPVEVDRAGMCLNCYVRELARAHEAEIDLRRARREHDAARQRKHRARRGEAP